MSLPKYYFDIDYTWYRVITRNDRNVVNLIKSGMNALSIETEMYYFMAVLVIGGVHYSLRWLGGLGRKLGNTVAQDGYKEIHEKIKQTARAPKMVNNRPVELPYYWRRRRERSRFQDSFRDMTSKKLINRALGTFIMGFLLNMLERKIRASIPPLPWFLKWLFEKIFIRLIMGVLWGVLVPIELRLFWPKLMSAWALGVAVNEEIGPLIMKMISRRNTYNLLNPLTGGPRRRPRPPIPPRPRPK
jgi:hypothetical protein